MFGITFTLYDYQGVEISGCLFLCMLIQQLDDTNCEITSAVAAEEEKFLVKLAPVKPQGNGDQEGKEGART